MLKDMFNEFKGYIESGFGKIYAEDIPKYWDMVIGDDLTEEEIAQLEQYLSESNMIQFED